MVSVDPGSFKCFGELLKFLRQRARLTQRELGAAVSYSYAQITRLETGQRRPDPAAVSARFLDALDLGEQPIFARRLVELAVQAQRGNSTRPAPLQGVAHDPGSSVPTNLTIPLTRFIGRQHDIAEVRRLLAENRLVTLTGAGGVGKTRLAVEVGASFVEAGLAPAWRDLPQVRSVPQPSFPDGVWLAELAAISEPALAPGVLARLFGLVSASRTAQEVVTDYLRNRRLLLILDNCEHLIAMCAELVEALLSKCPRLCILATSREGLNVPGEVNWRVPSMPSDEAAQLFEACVEAAQPQFSMTDQNRAAMLRICARLDGIPLAIELAAARVRTFTPEQIESHLNDVFHLLVAGSRTALPRHQTLRALIDWSYNLLPEQERLLLTRLSVFAGGWTLDAAQAVAADTSGNDVTADTPLSVIAHMDARLSAEDIPALLDQLVSKSLVNVNPALAAGDRGARYHMLEMVRQYARDALQASSTGAWEKLRNRHLAYVCALVKPMTLMLCPGYTHTPDEDEWVDDSSRQLWYDVMEEEIDNLRAALAWIVQTRDMRSGIYLINLLAHSIWVDRGYCTEGLRWIKTVVTEGWLADDAGASAVAYVDMGILANNKGDSYHAHMYYETALALARKTKHEGVLLDALCGLSWTTPDAVKASEYIHELLDITPQSAGVWYAANAEFNLAVRARRSGNFTEATNHLLMVMRDRRDKDDLGFMAELLLELGHVARAQDDIITACKCYEQALANRRQLHDLLGCAKCLVELCACAVHTDDADAAVPMVQECISIFAVMDNLKNVGKSLAAAAGIALLRHDVRCAATLLCAAETMWVYLTPYDDRSDYQIEYNRLLPLVRAALPPTEFENARAAGQRMTLDQAIAAVKAL